MKTDMGGWRVKIVTSVTFDCNYSLDVHSPTKLHLQQIQECMLLTVLS